ncbi:MAG: DUF167 domain-containing protein [Spirochaetes bacterium]|nr:DUF167 domain-containing protein [Spirochaetota bacterium]
MNKKAIFDIIVIPKSSMSEIKIDQHANIKIYLNSPPVDGKANIECMGLLSSKLKTAKSNISIIKGTHGRNKRISVAGMSIEEIIERLKNL